MLLTGYLMLTIKHALSFATWYLGSLLVAPALAQNTTGPWVTVPNGPAPTSYYTVMKVASPAPDVVWATAFGNYGMTGTSYFISASADNGLTWQTNRTINFSDVGVIDGQQAWGIANGLYHTTTGPNGFALTPEQVPGTPLLVRFFSPGVGLVVGLPPAGAATWPLYRTADGGQSWQLLANAPALVGADRPLFGTVLGSQLWVTTTLGYLLRTTDAGLTWTSTQLPERLDKLAFRDAQHGLALGAATTRPLYRTTDGGATWTLLAPTGPRRLNDLAAFPGSTNTYLSVGSTILFPARSNGTARSTDDGQTWQDLGGTEPLDYVVINAAGQAWASAGGAGTLRQFAGAVLATRSGSGPAAGLAYPNPTTGQLRLPAAGAYKQVTVYDAAGRLCRTAPLGSAETTLDLGSLVAGLYLLRYSGPAAAPQQQRLVVAP